MIWLWILLLGGAAWLYSRNPDNKKTRSGVRTIRGKRWNEQMVIDNPRTGVRTIRGRRGWNEHIVVDNQLVYNSDPDILTSDIDFPAQGVLLQLRGQPDVYLRNDSDGAIPQSRFAVMARLQSGMGITVLPVRAGKGSVSIPVGEIQWAQGLLLRGRDRADTYVIWQGVLRSLQRVEILEFAQRGLFPTIVPGYVIDAMRIGVPFGMEMRLVSSPRVPGVDTTNHLWFIANGVRRRVTSWEAVAAAGMQSRETSIVDWRQIENMKRGEDADLGVLVRWRDLPDSRFDVLRRSVSGEGVGV